MNRELVGNSYDILDLWYTRYNLGYMTLNKNHLVIQTHHSMLELLVKLKPILSDSVIIARVLSTIWTSIVITTWLNCCKDFWWFYCVDINDIVFVVFRFLVSYVFANNIKSRVNNIVPVIVCLGLRFWFLFQVLF